MGTEAKLTFQVLLSTMGQSDLDIVRRMNITSDALVINQAGRHSKLDQSCDHKVRMLSFAERGIGLSRNTALDRAWADISLFSDDDIVYRTDLQKTVLDAFMAHKEADVIVFNLASDDPHRSLFHHKSSKRVGLKALRYGMPRVAVRTASVRRANIHFSLGFGGGALYGSGEDTLFMADCLRSGLHIRSDPAILGELSFADSSWYEGRNRRYFNDKGALFAALFPRTWPIFALRFWARTRPTKIDEVKPLEALVSLIRGARGWRSTTF